MDSQNPYQAPSAYQLPAEDVEELGDLPLQPASPLRSLVRWSFVCFISAAPSFFWGMVIADENFAMKGAAMVTGVLIFVAMYTAVDCTRQIRKLMTDRTFRLVAKIVYGTRIGMSILFPIGLYIDMIFGLFSIAATTTVFQIDHQQGPVAPLADSFWAFLATTLFQGVLLNFFLFAYALVVLAFVLAIKYIRAH